MSYPEPHKPWLMVQPQTFEMTITQVRPKWWHPVKFWRWAREHGWRTTQVKITLHNVELSWAKGFKP